MKSLTPPKVVLALILAAALIPGANADQVFLDDIIVDGSACIGFDCVNGESFGFDTLRLKENNLRIKFQDTSNTSSFPTQDWQLTANDTSNGGANKFSIDAIAPSSSTPFTIEAGSNSDSLYVDSGGRIGLGTNNPVVDVHVKSGNTPTLRLEQDGSSGFTPQTWDVAGNEANFFVRDATSGSTLPFRIYPGAPSSALNIEGSTGDIGMGTTTPDSELHVHQTADETTQILIECDNARNTGLRLINSVGDWTHQLNNGNQIIWNTGGLPAEMVLDTGGNLEVTGSLAVSGMALTVPDFVFEDTYELMPLSDLGEFVEREKHLPEIPSASEINDGGKLNMTEMQLKLLQKVEELTLYTLEQQKLIDELREQVGAKKAAE